MSVKIALVGCGMWGRNIARNAYELGVLHAVCDTNTDNAAMFAGDFKTESMTFSDILNASEIDGVIIVTNAVSHQTLACQALLAGKHVYIEKPLTLSMAAANEIAIASDSSKKQVMVGHLIQYHPAFIALKQQVQAGMIGTLKHIQANRLAMGRIRKSESVIYDLCPHDLSLILGLTGVMPLSVQCHSASHITSGVADMVAAGLSFPDKITAMIHTSWYSPYKEHRLTVTGSTGSIVFDDTKPWPEKLMHYHDNIYNSGDAFQIERTGPIALHVTPGEPLKDEVRAFVNVCKSGLPALTSLDEALRVQQILAEMERQTKELVE